MNNKLREAVVPWLILLVIIILLYILLNNILLGLWALSEPLSHVMP